MTNLKDFIIEAFELDPTELSQGETVNVSEKNIGVLSYNIKESKVEYKKVLNLIRKKDESIYVVIINDQRIEVTGDHKFYAKLSKSPAYIKCNELFKIQKIEDVYLLNFNNEFQKIQEIRREKTKHPIYDIEVEDNHNYFVNGFLSHNTMFGSPTTTQGGHALKFYSDCRIEVSRSLAKEGDVTYGNVTKVKTIKNKMFPPYRTTSFEIVYGKGIDTFAELMELGYNYDVLYKRGDVIRYKEEKFKYSEFETLLGDNPELEKSITAEIIKRIKNENLTPEKNNEEL